MSLEDLNRELYKNDSKVISARKREASEYDLVSSAVEQPKSNPFFQEEMWQKEKKEIAALRRKKILITVGAVLLTLSLIGGAVYFYQWWQKNAFHQDRVEVYFEGPTEADSMQQTKYVIHYKNNNRVSLKNAELELTYSENFQPVDNTNLKIFSPSSGKIFVGDIRPMSEGSVELKGIFYAPEDYPLFLKTTFNFMPSNGSETLSMDSQINIKITAAPIALDLSVPKQAANGDQVEYLIKYRNLDIRSIGDLRIKIDFPSGFEMKIADPQPLEGESYWRIGSLEPNQEGKITIRGSLSGSDGENKDIVVSMGHQGSNGELVVFNRSQASTTVVAPLLGIMQKLQNKEGNVIYPGETLKYMLSYRNTGDMGLRNAIITAEIQSKVLDFSKIKIEKGSFDGSTNTITWKASGIPGLANIDPGQGGEVYFLIPVKTMIPVDSSEDKNFVVTSVAKIDSPDIPTPVDSNKIIGSNTLELRLASKVIFETKAFYNDSKIRNSGPIPMETNRETTFSVHWAVANISNDLSGARIVSSLPSGIKWTGQIYPADEKISYDSRTNQVVWDIGDIPAGTGVLVPAREVVFQIGVVPQVNQIGEPIPIVNKSIFTAKDKFANVDIIKSIEQKDTQLPEDPGVGYANSKVAR
ncbi:MAG TPA: hypothetical protein PLF30_02765 [Candidatus Moranbacteria bacterium]|jgi:hypothetical protein|nr:hypothetical protein [Candidatus Moranbacteria bacterium]HOF42616.1 hypothetical protein [Candidatus Moranbacteria bacterium]HPX94453.1 hypothetical protein [Candidatus Moranbacteria bacterium]HQB59630.1 hypothetical protein [Candidatus Moranbacteria bacterium]